MQKKTIRVLSLLSIALLSGCSDRASGPAEIVNARAQSSYHIVKKGETIDQICKKYKISRSDFIALNNLKSPYKLFNKQRVKIKTIESLNSHYYASGDDLVVKNLDDDKTLNTSSANDIQQKKESSDLQVGTTDLNAQPFNSNNEMSLSKEVASDDLPNESLTTQNRPSTEQSPVNTTPYEGTSLYDWPVFGKVVQSFGQKGSDGAVQQSLSIQAPAGTKVKSVAEGEVVRAGKIRELQELGNIAIVEQKDGHRAIYGFLKEVYVKKGQHIDKGSVIGTVGVNKAKNKAMLVFQLRAKKGGKSIPVDPMKFLPS